MSRGKESLLKHETVNGYLVRLEDLSFDQAEAVLDFKRRNPRLSQGEVALLLGFVDRIPVDSDGTAEVEDVVDEV